MIRAEGLGKRFGDRWAVRDLTLDVARGEVVGFLGPNGAGKTTTVRMLAGLIAPTEGRAWIDGRAVGAGADDERRRIGLLTEAPGLYERLSARRNLDLHARLQGLPGPLRAERVRACLELVGLWERRDELVGGFSKGMKQRLAIARTLLHEPDAVFLDEPTSGLDPESAGAVRAAIRDLRGAGRAIFLCTHNLDEARRLCDRVAIFRTRLLRLGTPAELERTVPRRRVVVRLADDAAAYAPLVARMPWVRAVEQDAAGLLVELADADRDAPALVRGLVEAGAAVQRVAEADALLERAYLEAIGEDGASDLGGRAGAAGDAARASSPEDRAATAVQAATATGAPAGHAAAGADGAAAGDGARTVPE
jgi:ABC-2 type transport system ATP-binding protein